jgi:hypothetical protein
MLSSINVSKAPVLILASLVQLVLNLFEFCYIVLRESDFVGEDHEQHVDERPGWDIY